MYSIFFFFDKVNFGGQGISTNLVGFI